jgi:hypothetical protein
MKKTILPAGLTAVLLLLSLLMGTSGFAAKIEGETFDLVAENSGYQVIVPNFIELKQVEIAIGNQEPKKIWAVVMKRPEKNSQGQYPIFQIVTTDKSAHRVEAYPGTFQDGQLGSFTGEFAGGELMFSPTLNVESLQSLGKDRVFIFDFTAYDQNLNAVFSVYDLYFMFADEVPSTVQLKPVSVKPTSSGIVVDGKTIAFEAYLINDFNYFKLRDLAMAVNGSRRQFEVSWDDVNKAINLLPGASYTSDGSELIVSGSKAAQQATPNTAKIFIDGVETQLTAYNIGGYNYFKLRDIAQAIDFNVTWDAATNMVGIDTANGYVAP